MAPGFRAACRRLLQEVQWLGWQALWVGSGLWLAVLVCLDRLVMDSSEALEWSRPQAKETGWERLLRGVRGRLARGARRCAARTSAWRRLAARVDMALLERRSATRRDGA